MDLGTDMLSDEADDALAVSWGEPEARILEAAGQPIKPEPPVGVEHDLDPGRVVEEARDRGPERRAKHAGTARVGLGPKGDDGHFNRPRMRHPDEGGSSNITGHKAADREQFNKRQGVAEEERTKAATRC